MSKQVESSLLIASSFSEHAAFYQQLLKGIASYEALTARILVHIKTAHAFRQTSKVRELARILVHLPLSEARLIGQCYLAWCECRAQNYNAALLESVIDQTHIYKAHALISRAAIEFYQGRYDDALRFYLESLKARPTPSEYALAVKGIAVIKSIEGFTAQAIRDLSNLTALLSYTEPVVYFDCLNSYAVELSKAGQLDDASSISTLVQTSPFAFAYPEWRETFSEIKSKRKRRSTVTLSRSQIEQGYEPEIDIPEISKARVEAGIEFLNANFHRKIVLDEIAAVVNISVEHFSRIFKIETGITPIDYLIKLRIEKASQLLKSSFLSVKEVMASVGYNSKGLFTNHFKRQFGITPSEYRKRFFRRA